MKKIRIWYDLTHSQDKKTWTVWMNREYIKNEEIGGLGSMGIYTSEKKQDCIEYCRKAGIKLEKGNGYIIKRNNNKHNSKYSVTRDNT